MSTLTKKIINYKCKVLNKKATARKAIGFDVATSIGVIYTTAGRPKHDAVKKLVKNFKAEKKNVEILTLLPKNEENHDFLFDYFEKGDFSFFGRINSDLLKEFIIKPFDFLIFIDINANEYFKYILAASSAKCRVGCHNDENTVYLDLMVMKPLDNNFNTLVENIINLVKKI